MRGDMLILAWLLFGSTWTRSGAVLLYLGASSWLWGGPLGLIYWAAQTDCLHAALSVSVPFYGVGSMCADLLF